MRLWGTHVMMKNRCADIVTRFRRSARRRVETLGAAHAVGREWCRHGIDVVALLVWRVFGFHNTSSRSNSVRPGFAGIPPESPKPHRQCGDDPTRIRRTFFPELNAVLAAPAGRVSSVNQSFKSRCFTLCYSTWNKRNKLKPGLFQGQASCWVLIVARRISLSPRRIVKRLRI